MPLDKPGVTSIITPFYVRILHLVFTLENLLSQLEKGSFNVRPSDSFLCRYNVINAHLMLTRYNLFKLGLQLELLPQLKH